MREGEYTGFRPTQPFMISGDVDKLQVRDDEAGQKAPLVQSNQPAGVLVNGSARYPLSLRSVRIEPEPVFKPGLSL